MRSARRELSLAWTVTAAAVMAVLQSSAAEVSGHYQSTVAISGIREGQPDADWYNGVRLSLDHGLGSLEFGAAYEFQIDRANTGQEFDTDWLNLQETISRGDELETRHRLDRLQISWSPTEAADLTIGRQAISWATTLYFTPADPFVPFSPTDTFREYRRGVDALRLRFYPDALSEIELVVRPSRLGEAEELTVLGRAITTWRDWDVSAWGGTLYGDSAFAVGAAGDVSDWGVRFESVFRDTGRQVIGRGAVGVSRIFQVKDRDLDLILEYQHDGLGADSETAFGAVMESAAFRRGELQVIGRDQALARVAYQVHPLWEISGLVLWNLNLNGGVLAPGFSYSVSDNASLNGTVYSEIGNPMAGTDDSTATDGRPKAISALLSLTWYL